MKSPYEVQPEEFFDSGTSRDFLVRLAYRSETVLDVGCSNGGLGAVLMAKGKVVVGIDIDEGAVAAARVAGLEAHVADIQQTPLTSIVGSRRFDCVIFGDVLEHLVDPGSVLAGAREVLSAEGFVLVSVPNVANASMRLALLTNRWDERDMGLLDRTHLRFFTLDTFLDLADSCGFMVTAVERVASETREPSQEHVLGVRDVRLMPQWIVDAAHFGDEADVLQFVFRLEPLEPEWTSSEAARAAAVKARIELRDARRQLARVRAYEQREVEIERRDREVYLEGLRLRDEFMGLSARLASAEERAREAQFFLESETQYLKSELESVLNSVAWKVGRFCTFPARVLRRAFRAAR